MVQPFASEPIEILSTNPSDSFETGSPTALDLAKGDFSILLARQGLEPSAVRAVLAENFDDLASDGKPPPFEGSSFSYPSIRSRRKRFPADSFESGAWIWSPNS
jgi:hypothetical protein